MAVETGIEDEGRLAALFRHGIPGVNFGDGLEAVVNIARVSIRAPIAAVTAVERNQQSFLACKGLEAPAMPLSQSFCAKTIADNQPLIVPDAAADPAFAHMDLVRGPTAIRAYMGVPMVSADGYALGTVCVMDTQPRIFTEGELAVLLDLAQLAVAQLATRQPDTFDLVTGALSRRRFQADVEREFVRTGRYERPACLVFIDLDNFAEVNAAVGPAMGDEVLKAISNRCREVLRATDTFGRISGQEFGMLLPETLAYEASQCAERLRETISRMRFRAGDGILSLTASFGVAPFSEGIKSAVHWFAQADLAVMNAKRAGRDCVAFAPAVDQAAILKADEAAIETSNARLH